MTAPVNVPTRLHLSALYAGTLRLMADRDQEFDDIEAARAATAEVFDYQFSRWASGAQALALLPELARATPDAVDELFRSTLTSHGYPVPDPIPLVEWLDGDHHTTVI
ncbi:MAG TPA: hypothetical protein VLF67_00180, partial [Candidatus Saccharimonas sp.]|nr:hypothetical protein [Candidatus Saccharimonas sp.]